MDASNPLLRHSLSIVLTCVVVGIIVIAVNSTQVKVLPYSEFVSHLHAGQLDNLLLEPHRITGTFTNNGKALPFVTNRVEQQLAAELSKAGVKFSAASEESWASSLFSFLATSTIVLFIVGVFAQRFRDQTSGTGLSSPFQSIERNRARFYVEDKIKITFADVAGVDEAKEELQEVIDFLRQPESYSRLGAHLPKGILLVGAPGTGKTLLAKAVAGEAGVAFFSISGSEFVELFVGVGAARVRDLFMQARKKAPCIIFIDELDALGRSRAANPLGAHDEKEQTLNQLLVELDGFDASTGVVLLAATNRPEILDDALLRAGRFDRHIAVDKPDKVGRIEILKVHTRNVKCAADIHMESLAAITAGFTGADLANLVNEAALLAARRKADLVLNSDFENALERIVAGLEKKRRLANNKERRTVAYHETGHALVSILLPSTDKVQKVSIIPRGIGALGYTVQRPDGDRSLLTRTEIECKLTALLGGRAAECLVFDEPSSGAGDDLSKATELARSSITKFGMHPEVGLMTMEISSGPFLPSAGNERLLVSSQTAREVDCAIRAMLAEAFARATNLLSSKTEWLHNAAEKLLEEETLTVEQIWQCKPDGSAPIDRSLAITGVSR